MKVYAYKTMLFFSIIIPKITHKTLVEFSSNSDVSFAEVGKHSELCDTIYSVVAKIWKINNLSSMTNLL